MPEIGRRLVGSPKGPPNIGLDTWGAILESGATDPSGPLRTFTPTIQQLHAMYLVDGEVNNGGFNQLFFNGGGPWVARAAEGFERAGLNGHRDVVLHVQRPAAAEEPMRDAAHAAKTLQAFADTYDETDLGEFDDRWYGLPDIYETLDQFVVDHASDIWE
jgi:hypothetical protein